MAVSVVLPTHGQALAVLCLLKMLGWQLFSMIAVTQKNRSTAEADGKDQLLS